MTDAPKKKYCPRGPGPDCPFAPHLTGEMEWREDGTCSFCGSLSEEEFFKSIEREEELGTTTKNYKVYIGRRKKFYFQHLGQTGKLKFIELLNAKAINFSGSMGFNPLPFFVKAKSTGETTNE